jgi:hypothetical protein
VPIIVERGSAVTVVIKIIIIIIIIAIIIERSYLSFSERRSTK